MWLWTIFGIIVVFIIITPKNNNHSASPSAPIVTPANYAEQSTSNSNLSKEDINQAFTSCLSDKAKTGPYTSNDGGKSAINLMGACEVEWHAWADRCVADGSTDGDCTLTAGVLAQSAIKLSGK